MTHAHDKDAQEPRTAVLGADQDSEAIGRLPEPRMVIGALMAGGNQLFQDELNEQRLEDQHQDCLDAWKEWRSRLTPEQVGKVETFLKANPGRIRLQPWTVWRMMTQKAGME